MQLERERIVALAQVQEQEAATLREHQARAQLLSETQSSGVSEEIRTLRSELEEQKMLPEARIASVPEENVKAM
eukprot:14814938-Alexandrium_andersonii.AAC.1